MYKTKTKLKTENRKKTKTKKEKEKETKKKKEKEGKTKKTKKNTAFGEGSRTFPKPVGNKLQNGPAHTRTGRSPGVRATVLARDLRRL